MMITFFLLSIKFVGIYCHQLLYRSIKQLMYKAIVSGSAFEQ